MNSLPTVREIDRLYKYLDDKFDEVDRRFDGVDRRMDVANGRVTKNEERITVLELARAAQAILSGKAEIVPERTKQTLIAIGLVVIAGSGVLLEKLGEVFLHRLLSVFRP